MHWSTVVAAALAGIATAHGGDDHLHGLPKIVGGRKVLSELRARRFEPGRAPPPNVARAERNQASEGPSLPPLDRRQNGGTSGRCGPGRGSCAGGYCCSAEGWCGLTEEYCSSPDCQINYGSGCDGNQRPSGVDTSTVARPHLGDVLYGGLGIYDCDKAGDIALTFDDGPYDYTGDLLDKFADYGAKATFFITGNNLGKGMINDASKPWAGFIKRMIAEGHQVASHTWSHENSSAVSQQQWRDQMIYNEIAFNDILGFFPTYMRPPYSICEKTCQTILSALGYHVVYFDLDTEGYLHDDPSAIQDSKDIWDDAVGPSRPARDSFLQIEHDIHWQSVYNLTDYFLTSLFSKGYRSVTVGECLGDPPENWYRAGSGSLPGQDPPPPSRPPPPPTSTRTSVRTTPTPRTRTTRTTTRKSTTTTATRTRTTAKTSTIIGRPTSTDPPPEPSRSTTIRPPSDGGPATTSATATATATTTRSRVPDSPISRPPVSTTPTRVPDRPITRSTRPPGVTISIPPLVTIQLPPPPGPPEGPPPEGPPEEPDAGTE